MNRHVSIEIRDFSTGYAHGSKEKIVTHNLNASLYSGELTCLLGPNGAGKSTLLRTLAGFQKPIGGTERMLGKDMLNYSDKELSRTISVVLTEKPNLDNMDVEALISLGRAPYTGFWGRLCKKDKEEINHAIELTGIEALRHRTIQTLSDGERQKVMIAKSLAQSTPIIFLDEPTAFLDYPSKVDILRLLFTLAHTADKTIFMSTHDLELALQLSDRIWLIDKKLGVTTGTPSELAISGDTERYFVRPGIIFDHKEGIFRVNKNYFRNEE